MAALVYGGRYIVDSTPKRAGGMGEVIVCTDPHLDRKVAIKFLKPGQDARRMLDELKGLQQVRSKHVVQVYDIITREPDKAIGVVQEYLPNEDLTDFHKTATLESYLKAIYQLAAGLEDIHAQDVIHRDFKHNNVKHSNERLLKIFDFGLSRMAEDAQAQTTGFRGTHGYAAPELYANGRVKFTKAIDVYAFAATALYMAEGRFPACMRPQRPPNAEQWIATGGFASLPIKIPSRLVPTMDECLKTDPTARPSMAEVRLAIERRLTRWDHRGLLVHQGNTVLCNRDNPTATLAKPGIATVTVEYRGLGFVVAQTSGPAFVNNRPAYVNMVIPGSCVITLGSGNDRDFITLDISRPEVVL